MARSIKMCPRVNKANGQMNFSLKKSQLPKRIKKQLPNLKSVRLTWEDFEFD